MSASRIVRRGMLYVPASSQKLLAKARGLSVDCAVFDLEDSVVPEQKEAARITLTNFLQQSRPSQLREVAVRINAADTKHCLRDLDTVLDMHHVDTIVVPKVQSAADLTFVTDVIRQRLSGRRTEQTRYAREGTDSHLPGIIALIETAKGLINLDKISSASPLTNGLAFAAEDFCRDLSITRSSSLCELLYARSRIVVAARAHSIPSVLDLVYTAVRKQDKRDGNDNAFVAECVDGRQLGFTGKQLIHPDQIAAAHRIFAPSPAELAWAVSVVEGDRFAKHERRGAWVLNGQMVDAPVVERAERLLAEAARCDLPIPDTLKEKSTDPKT